MKTNILHYCICLLLAFVLFNCGGKEDKKKAPLYPAKTKTKTKVTKTESLIDLSNTGIGPITSLTFDADIDKALADKGKAVFQQLCTACHKTDKKFIGPAMKGVYEKRHPAWVMNMILNPTEMIEKDPIAKQQFKEYNSTIMINQNLEQDQARAIAEYLRTL